MEWHSPWRATSVFSLRYWAVFQWEVGLKTATESKVNLAGWILFVMSALGFIVSSLRSGDAVALLASVFFFVGCIVFLIPYVMPLRRSGPR